MHFDNHAALSPYKSLRVPVWVFDVENHCMWWANNAALEFWQCDTLEQLLDRNFSTDSASVRNRLREIASLPDGDAPVSEVWTLYPKDSPKSTLISFQPVTIETRRQAVLIEATDTNVTLGTEETARILEAARVTPFLISTFNSDGRLLSQNPAATACYGRPKPSAKGTCTDLVRRVGDEELAQEVLERAFDDDSFSWELEVNTRSGFRTHLASARKGRDPISGEFVLVLCEEDVSDLAAWRMRQENLNDELNRLIETRTRELKLSEERYQLAVSTASIWDWNLSDDTFYVSENFATTLGYQHEELSKRISDSKIYALVHPDDVHGLRSTLSGHIRNPGKPLTHEMRFRTKAGEYVWFRAQGKCVLDENGIPSRSIGLLTDITEQRHLEKQLMASQRMEAIGRLTGGVAHDFNNLLSVIQGNAELLRAIGYLDDELISEIIGAVRSGANLTSQLLAYAGRQTLRPQTVSLTDLLEKMKKSLFRVLRENINVTVRSPVNIRPLSVDPTQLETAILNLAINARDAMPDGGDLKLECFNMDRATEQSSADGEWFVQLKVTDNGTGISADDLPRVFEPFYTTKDVGKGSGLGLSMVKGFAKQSGGDCKIESEQGKGTTVLLTLPASKEFVDADVTPATMELVKGNMQTVHLIEDNIGVQRTIKRMLEWLGYAVVASSDATAAMAQLNDGIGADLFLVDVILPGGLSGVEIAQEIRSKYPDAKILLMSGYPHLSSEISHMPLPYLQKPIDQAALSKVLKALIGEESPD